MARQRARWDKWVLTAAAIASLGFGAAAQADGQDEARTMRAEDLHPDERFFANVNTVVLPQILEQNVETRGRSYRKSTLLQLDTPLGHRSDLMLRVQAKHRKFLFLELRF